MSHAKIAKYWAVYRFSKRAFFSYTSSAQWQLTDMSFDYYLFIVDMFDLGEIASKVVSISLKYITKILSKSVE